MWSVNFHEVLEETVSSHLDVEFIEVLSERADFLIIGDGTFSVRNNKSNGHLGTRQCTYNMRLTNC